MYMPGGPKDVVVHVVTASRHRDTEIRDREGRRAQIFDALIYSRLSLPVQAPATPTRYSDERRNLPLIGVERITLTGADYDAYIASFLEGEKGLTMMRDRLLDAMSPGLRALLTQPTQDMRIWWSSATPELEDCPWELTVPARPLSTGPRVVFLRGLPPETPLPALPLSGAAPRLAIVGPPHLRPAWAQALETLDPRPKLIDLPLREGLALAVHEGYELVHLFTDGTVSSALEGMLYDHDARRTRPDCPANDLSAMLSGSRVALLSLSPDAYRDPDVHEIAGRSVLSAFRAFAYLGASYTWPLPSVATPLGPVPDEWMARFWTRFYTELIGKWHMIDALCAAQGQFPLSMPIALFSRHAGGKLFTSRAVSFSNLESVAKSAADDDTQPLKVRQTLLESEDLTTALSRLSQKYADLPDTVKGLLREERERQDKLRGVLDSWIDPKDEL